MNTDVQSGQGEPDGSVSDVFLSYAHSDRSAVLTVADALRAAGLRVWVSASDVEKFESIQAAVERGLANAKVLVAYYSKEYPTRRACQWELTAAYLAAGHESDPRRRILVLNPEPGFSHVVPKDLHDEAMFRVSDDNLPKRLPEIASAVKQRVSTVQRVFGDLRSLAPPRWWGNDSSASSPSRFVGRLAEMWQLHLMLLASELPLILGGTALGQVRGLGGIGKSLLAEEYARRFGAAYPGGIFWLRCHGNDDSKLRMSAEEREAERVRQIRGFLESMGVGTDGTKVEGLSKLLAQEIARRGKRCLWVADDVPSSLTKDELDKWLAPTPHARCVITTRSREYSAIGAYTDLEVLPLEDAIALLSHHLGDLSSEDRYEAELLVADLGHHAMAIDIAGGVLQLSRGIVNIKEFRVRLKSPSKDALELAARLSHILPNGHQSSIVETLLGGVRKLGRDAQDFLRLASVLAVAPITPEFACAVLMRAGGISKGESVSRLQQAFRELDRLSLTSTAGGSIGARTVHTLVSRAMRHLDRATATHWMTGKTRRRENLRRAAIEQIKASLRDAVNRAAIKQHLDLALHHASELATRPTDLPEPELLEHLAAFELERGAYKSASRLFQRVHSLVKQREGVDSAHALAIEIDLVAVYLTWGAADIAEVKALDALERCERMWGLRNGYAIIIRHALAQCYRAQNKLQQAKDEHLKVISLMQETSFSPTDFMGTRQNLAEVLQALGDVPQAEAIQREIVIEYRRIYGSRHPTTLLAINNLAVIVGQQQSGFEEEHSLLREAITIREEVSGIQHPQTSIVAWNLVLCLRKLKRDVDADEIKGRYLNYLLERDIESLGADQHRIRTWLMTGSYDTIASAVHASERVADLVKTSSSIEKESDPMITGFVQTGFHNPKRLLTVWSYIYRDPARIVDNLASMQSVIGARFGLKSFLWILLAVFAIGLVSPEDPEGAINFNRDCFWTAAFFVTSALHLLGYGTILLTGITLLKKRSVWAVLVWIGFLLILHLSSKLEAAKSIIWTVPLALEVGLFWGLLVSVICGALHVAQSGRSVLITVLIGATMVAFSFGPAAPIRLAAAVGWIVGFLRLYYLPLHLVLLPFRGPPWLLRLHPVFWDRLIRFPLVGLTSFLVNFYRCHSVEADEGIQVVMDAYPSQARFAVGARMAVALDEWL